MVPPRAQLEDGQVTVLIDDAVPGLQAPELVEWMEHDQFVLMVTGS